MTINALLNWKQTFSAIGVRRYGEKVPVAGKWGEFCLSDSHRKKQLFSLLAIPMLMAGWLLPLSLAEASSPGLSYLIERVARQEGVDSELLHAMVATESGFNAQSVSTKGAAGLLQLMPATARAMGVVNRFNPEENLRGGARYIRHLLERFDDLSLALAAYNAGPGNVIRYQGVPPFAETKDYVFRVLRHYQKLETRKTGALTAKPKRRPPQDKELLRTIYRFQRDDGTLVLTDRVPASASPESPAKVQTITVKQKTATPPLAREKVVLSAPTNPQLGQQATAQATIRPNSDRSGTISITPSVSHTVKKDAVPLARASQSQAATHTRQTNAISSPEENRQSVKITALPPLPPAPTGLEVTTITEEPTRPEKTATVEPPLPTDTKNVIRRVSNSERSETVPLLANRKQARTIRLVSNLGHVEGFGDAGTGTLRTSR
ncbi:MAG: lytic transglycosylase domain-containing protein [Magnetococcales bacterium]|nr:lytic transglycosylase domain-containing protein [Magnetococcales bacterium]